MIERDAYYVSGRGAAWWVVQRATETRRLTPVGPFESEDKAESWARARVTDPTTTRRNDVPR